MADSNRVLNATIAKYVKDKLEHAYLQKTTLLNKFKEVGSIQMGAAGIDRRWPVKKTRNPNWASFSPFSNLNVTAIDNTVMLELDWGSYNSSDFLPTKEILQNGSGDTRIYDLVKTHTDDLVDDAGIDLHTALWSDTGLNDKLVGFPTAVPNTDFTGKSYAGVAFTGNSWLQNYQVSGDSFAGSNYRTDALIAIEDAKLNCTYDSAPTWMVTTRTAFEYTARLHSSNERYGAETTRKMGGEGLIVHNMEMLWDPNATSAIVYLMNSSKIEMLFMTDSIFNVTTRDEVSPSGKLLYLECFPLLRITQPRYFAAISAAD